jgi:hypothetical protein
MTVTAVNEMYKASHSVHFVSDGQISQPLTVVGQVVLLLVFMLCFCWSGSVSVVGQVVLLLLVR